MVKAIVFLLTALALQSCASVNQQLDPNIFYKRDMLIEVNGHKGVGVLVVPRSGQYEIKGTAKGVLDLFTLTTCHREITRENGNYDFAEKLYPVRGIEDAGGCPVQLGGYEKKRGRHSWGFVDFEGADTTLPAMLQCNGVVSMGKGVSVCQSRAGLIQGIQFETPVHVAPDAGCEIKIPGDHKTFIFEIAPRECVYAFLEVAGGRVHRLTTIGYEGVLIRED